MIDKLSDKKILDLIQKGIIDISKIKQGLSDHRVADYARDIYRKNNYVEREKEVRKWIASVTINKNIIFE